MKSYTLRPDTFTLNFNVLFQVHKGRLVVDTSAGALGSNDPRPVTSASLFNVFSVTKGVAVTVLHILAEEGRLDYERTVASYWPAFAAAGKQDITVAELLSHRAGLQVRVVCAVCAVCAARECVCGLSRV